MIISRSTYNLLCQENPIGYLIQPDGKVTTLKQNTKYREKFPFIYSGSFNPFHAGHQFIIDWFNKSEYHEYGELTLEISIKRFEKPAFDYRWINSILGQFAWKYPVLLTNTEKYVDKVKLICPWDRNTMFIVGSDTAQRLCDCEGIDGVEKINCLFGIIRRGGYPALNIKKMPGNFTYIADVVSPTISSSDIRKELSHENVG